MNRNASLLRPFSSLRVILATVMVLAFASCETISGLIDSAAEIGILDEATRGELQAVVQSDTAVALAETARAVTEDFTPEQEYYIGRSVAAQILAQYPLLDAPAAEEYLQTLGQLIALSSPRPVVFRGYSFAILDSAEVNAIATPGGHVLVSRGLLELAESEDDLAGILAHEVAHVVLAHGLASIRTGRVTESVLALAGAAASDLTGSQLSELTDTFGGSVQDIVQTVAVNGYSRNSERDADLMAVELMLALGYNPRALINVLQRMDQLYEQSPGGPGFFQTHPDPSDRVADLERELRRDELPSIAAPVLTIRQQRFEEFRRALEG